MPCNFCGKSSINPWTDKEEDICGECIGSKNAKPDVVTSETEKSSSSRGGWYWSKWVWVWLIIIWPVGVYGLVKRAPSEHRKWWWIGLGIFVLFSFVNGGGSSKPTEAEISACKKLIWQHNRYEPSRMIYSGKEYGAIIIDYATPTYGNYWKLRCKNGNPQVWAPGASMWMDI